MSVNLENLLKSIDKLEEAIYSAELTLSQGKKNSKYASRFDSYRRICDMQRRFSEEIFYLKAINNKNKEIVDSFTSTIKVFIDPFELTDNISKFLHFAETYK